MDISFLTPAAAFFALAALVPLAALAAGLRRVEAVRRAFSLDRRRRRPSAAVVLALVLLPALVGVAAAQPVIVRNRAALQRADAEVFFVVDTSLSMAARRGVHDPSRLARAKSEVRRLEASLGDIPAGLATVTDRALPVLLPTTDRALFDRALAQSVGIDRPAPSRRYRGRATSYEALVSMWGESFFTPGTRRWIVVALTDGEASPPTPTSSFRLAVLAAEADAETNHTDVSTLFVHVWAPGEHLYTAGGRVDRRYVSDPASGVDLQRYGALLHAEIFGESQLASVQRAIRKDAGAPAAWRKVSTPSRVPLAPWFVLAGVVPLALLLWRRNL